MDALLVQVPSQLRDHLRALRQRRGLTQAQVAALLGVTQSRYAYLEAHPEAVSTGRMLRVLALLGADMQLRVRETSARKPAPKSGDDW